MIVTAVFEIRLTETILLQIIIEPFAQCEVIFCCSGFKPRGKSDRRVLFMDEDQMKYDET